jgi:hypothetical protein
MSHWGADRRTIPTPECYCARDNGNGSYLPEACWYLPFGHI